jgi:hypothetical protein
MVFLPAANATYVEGSITQDTIWTLIDSPFVVSNNILVNQNVTLTIEPGVEIRFGGRFSFTVEGRIVANGTKDKTIRFTSNTYEPKPGDWNTLNFVGPQVSYLIGCVIEYGTNGVSIKNGHAEIRNSDVRRSKENGITTANGELNVQNCNISYSLQNGISATTSDLTAQDNTILQNTANGIYITGNGHTIIQRNRIIANKEGIVLSGNQTSGVNVSQNVIAANQENGVLINADAHTNIVITNNSLSSNKNGFYISTRTSTYITYNTISYNENGFVYGEGTHTVYYNDIYGNNIGMDAPPNCTVDAEYNFWGDPSGPYHASLNPAGRGNAISTNDANVQFISFLTKPIGHINARPIARLLADRILVPPNEMVMLFGAESSDDGQVDQYFFDFGDGNNSGWTTLSVFAHKYSRGGTYNAYLTVMDDFGATSANTAVAISVQSLPSLRANVDVSKTTVHEKEDVLITVHVTNGIIPIENASIMMFSIKGGNFTPYTGTTDSTGVFVTAFTVPDVAEFASVRIMARASMTGYANGAGYEYLEILPFLSVNVIPDSNRVKSEGSTPITISVTSNNQPVANAYLTMSSDEGSISSVTGTTNLNGVFSLVFAAPLTTQGLNATITATARKDSFVDGAGNAHVIIEPKILDVHVLAESNTMISEAKTNVTVKVEYEGTPVEGADVSIVAANGTLSQLSGLTDANGSVKFVYAAPAIKDQTTVTITANASRFGYIGNQNQMVVIVKPRTFNVMVKTDRNMTQTEGAVNVTISVVCNEDGEPVADALVTMSSSDGNFIDPVSVTDSKGHRSFIFKAPQTTAEITVTMAANVTKNGYVDGGNQTMITVTPGASAETGGGLSLIIILLIAILIVIVVIVVVLVKSKIIAFSSQDET